MESVDQEYTRVSSILAQWDTYGHIDKEVLQRKCDIGTRVHEAIDNHQKGIYTPLDESTSGYFESYLLWEKNVKPNILHNEQRFYCKDLMITGQVDAIITTKDIPYPSLLDYKTSFEESKKMWPLQACFYRYLAMKNMIDLSELMYFLKLDKRGGLPQLFTYKFTEELWEVCKAALQCYHYIKG